MVQRAGKVQSPPTIPRYRLKQSHLEKLEYLREYPIGGDRTVARRNVPLELDYGVLTNSEPFNFCNFGWNYARKLEGRLQTGLHEGVWPINACRAEFCLGNPGNEVFPKGSTLDHVTPEILSAARRGRKLCYFRAISADEAIDCTAHNCDIRHATELTADWYDPDNGHVCCHEDQPEIIGSHSVPLGEFDGNFTFRNSWGQHWGDSGCGSFSRDHFEKFVIETWVQEGRGFSIPISAKSGIVCLEWKWSISQSIGVHGRAIVDASTGDRLAWAFCKKRLHTLDVEELFVWPDHRGNGYGRELTCMVKELAQTVHRPIRLLVSFADSYEWNRDGVQAIARMLGVRLRESSERYVHLIGKEVEEAEPLVVSRHVPMRPAIVLEMLRTRKEPPLEEPTPYEVLYGTNRQLETVDGKANFTGVRGDSLSIGWQRVSIPATYRFGSRGRAFTRWWNRVLGRVPRLGELVVCRDPVHFREQAQRGVWMADYKPYNLLYIHGYNTSFNDAITQGAQFGIDLKIPGRTFVFSWPSAGIYRGYQADEATVEVSLPALREYLGLILESTGEMPLNVVVHSMGNRAAIRLLESVARREIDTNRIQHVVFAAPDVDTQLFLQVSNKFAGAFKSATLYGTTGDWALQWSEFLHGGYPRAGLFPPVTLGEHFDTILVEGFDLANLGHGYYAEADRVLHDIYHLMLYGARPNERRCTVERIDSQTGRTYWALPLG